MGISTVKLFPECGHLKGVSRKDDNHRTKAAASPIDGFPAMRSGHSHGFRWPGGSGDIPVIGNPPHEKVPHAATHHIGFFSFLFQGAKNGQCPIINTACPLFFRHICRLIFMKMGRNMIQKAHGSLLSGKHFPILYEIYYILHCPLGQWERDAGAFEETFKFIRAK